MVKSFVPYKKRPYKKGKKSQCLSLNKVKSVIKSTALKNIETKRSTRHLENQNLNHNVTYYIDNLLRTEEGTSNPSGSSLVNNRVGNQVLGRGIGVKLWISNKTDRPNVMYKIFVFRHPTRIIASGMNDTIFWQGIDGTGGTMNRMIDHVAGNRVTLLKTITIEPNKEANYSQNPEKFEKSRLVDFYVPLKNKKIWYNMDNSMTPSFSDVAMAIVAYDAYGTLQTDIVASFAYNIRFYFKDP